MAKLFKTISLEERLKASQYNELPSGPKQVNQGSSEIVLPKTVVESEAIKLKITPSKGDLESQLLKFTAATKRIKALPAVGDFQTKSITSLGIPFTNSKFRSAISLRDRLQQPGLGSTAHLPQYFLSDQYTDYINIVLPKAVNQGSIAINTLLLKPTQGGNNPNQSRFNIKSAQGLYTTNGVDYSHIQLGVQTFDILRAQGLRLSNGILYSPTTTKPFVINALLLQGTTYSNSVYSSLITTKSLTPINDVKHGGVVIEKFVFKPIQGSVDPTKSITTSELNQGEIQLDTKAYVNFQPERKSPILNVLGYAADRLISRYTPRIKHGSATLKESNFKPNQGTIKLEESNFNKNFTPDQGQAANYKKPIDGKYFTAIGGEISPLLMGLSKTALGQSTDDVFKVWIDWQYNFVKPSFYNGNSKAPKYLSIEYIGNRPNPNTAAARALGSSTELETLSSFVSRNVDFPKNNEGSLGTYKTLTYSQIRARANSVSTQRSDFRRVLGGTPFDTSFSHGTTVSGQTDFINLTVGGITFRAFITAFSDSFNIGWNDLTYIGRQDTLKTFKGMTRGGSVSFKVAAFNKADLAANYGKLNNLVKSVGVGKPGGGYIIAPLSNITVGKWIVNAPVIFNSIKYDINPADNSWDLDAGVPMLIDVSLDFAYLGDVTGNSLNEAGNFLSYT